MQNFIYQIKISLKGSKPKIWRRVLIFPNVLLSDFHIIIQKVMGWENYHLHQFIHQKKYYCDEDHDDFWGFGDTNINYKKKKIKVFDLLKTEKDKMIYEYDFGDSWEHDIVLEKILLVEDTINYPICIAGKMNCPPEDCGGIWGYVDMLEALKNPESKEHEGFVEWIGADFDPKYFNIDEINQLLRFK